MGRKFIGENVFLLGVGSHDLSTLEINKNSKSPTKSKLEILVPGGKIANKKSLCKFRDDCHLKWTGNQPPLVMSQSTTVGKSKMLDLSH